jgi:hypothetical protein
MIIVVDIFSKSLSIVYLAWLYTSSFRQIFDILFRTEGVKYIYDSLEQMGYILFSGFNCSKNFMLQRIYQPFTHVDTCLNDRKNTCPGAKRHRLCPCRKILFLLAPWPHRLVPGAPNNFPPSEAQCVRRQCACPEACSFFFLLKRHSPFGHLRDEEFLFVRVWNVRRGARRWWRSDLIQSFRLPFSSPSAHHFLSFFPFSFCFPRYFLLLPERGSPTGHVASLLFSAWCASLYLRFFFLMMRSPTTCCYT